MTTLQNVIDRCKYNAVATKELAAIAGFNEEQLKFVDLFWDSAFNKTMLYLDDEMILENLTTDSSKDAIGNFVRQVLLPNFKVDIDYVQVENTHPLVEKFCSLNLKSKKDARGGSNKKYYLVTGETMKSLLQMAATKKGGVIRDYYLKIEKLVMLMRDYMSACKDHEMEQLRSQLEKMSINMHRIEESKRIVEEIARETIEKRDRVINGMKSLVAHTNILVNSEWLYSITTIDNAKSNRSTIGKANNLKHRLSNYNCKKHGDKKYYYTYARRCYDAHLAENTLRRVLKPFLVKGTLDMFDVREDYLHRIMDAVINGQDELIKRCNELLEAIKTQEYYENVIMSPPVQIPDEDDQISDELDSKTPKEPVFESLPSDIVESKLKILLDKYIQTELKMPFTYDKNKHTHYKSKDNRRQMIVVTWSKFIKFTRIELNQPIVAKSIMFYNIANIQRV